MILPLITAPVGDPGRPSQQLRQGPDRAAPSRGWVWCTGIARLVRDHWGVESLHWQPEDRRRPPGGHSPGGLIGQWQAWG